MNIYGISDLHLSGNPPYKPMLDFGPQYIGHIEKLETEFKRLPSGSVVINAGDISWSINREEALIDMKWLNSFGVKIINTRGNHDFFWGNKGASFMTNWALDNHLDNLYFVDHTTLFTIGEKPNFTVAAVKGSEKMEQYEIEFDVDKLPPGHKPKSVVVTPKHWNKHQRKLEAALALKPDILVSHIPPFDEGGVDNEWTRLIYGSGVAMVLFGHRHKSAPNAFDHTMRNDVMFHNLLCERCDFKPVLLAQVDEDRGTKRLWGVDSDGSTIVKERHLIPPMFVHTDITI